MTENRLRLLVALDCASPSEAVLRALLRLLDADTLDVTALYVEDEDVLRAARLPGAREISLSGHEVSLDAARLARDMAADVTAARQSFEHLARRLARQHRRLQHHFRVARGRMAEELNRAADQSDFVLVTRALRASGLRPRLARTFTGLVSQKKHVLFVNEPWASGSTVVVLGTRESALHFAERLADADDLGLVVALPPAAPPPQGLPPDARMRPLAEWNEAAIAELCLREDARLLVAPPQSGMDWEALLISLMDRLPCSLLKMA